MDILLVVIASYFILNKVKLEWALVIIMALGTNLFQASKVFKDFLYIPNIQDGALILILLMFIGGCAGSTGGGLKVSRLIIIFKAAFADVAHDLGAFCIEEFHADLNEGLYRFEAVEECQRVLLGREVTGDNNVFSH